MGMLKRSIAKTSSAGCGFHMRLLLIGIMLAISANALAQNKPPQRHDRAATGWTCICGCCDGIVDPISGACEVEVAYGLFVDDNIAQCTGDAPRDTLYCLAECARQAPTACSPPQWQGYCNGPTSKRPK